MSGGNHLEEEVVAVRSSLDLLPVQLFAGIPKVGHLDLGGNVKRLLRDLPEESVPFERGEFLGEKIQSFPGNSGQGFGESRDDRRVGLELIDLLCDNLMNSPPRVVGELPDGGLGALLSRGHLRNPGSAEVGQLSHDWPGAAGLPPPAAEDGEPGELAGELLGRDLGEPLPHVLLPDSRLD